MEGSTQYVLEKASTEIILKTPARQAPENPDMFTTPHHAEMGAASQPFTPQTPQASPYPTISTSSVHSFQMFCLGHPRRAAAST